MDVQPREIRNYLTSDGKSPFEDWFNRLRDTRAKAKIRTRFDRILKGNLGNYRSVGQGVFEFRIDDGPGYRIYFGQVELAIVVLLCGGDKSTQEQDIVKAKKYWADYERRTSTRQ
ncbi:MAG: type II toxin-antitoxin system RelE/ParE family toxin [Cyanobacteria bacterium CRU_2_1]|nr:type II toxin-antitoxin system RelE/ParE family toxin [Cyanobacteria bacterium RU_5_0]NJR63895.1 type II toxin-antitoxin system RelE/ParE family toxin [Cyanobacteria bacterium CRU_2_1]